MKSLIKRYFFLNPAIFCFLISLYACIGKKEKEINPQTYPNIILILADDQGWGATSVKMDKNISESASDFIRTPNLEKLSKKGVVCSTSND